MRVLDVACGTGNVALAAARLGCQTEGIDIATNLLAQAHARAAAEGLDIRFLGGDAEELPYTDGEFDAVVTMFGAMFTPRPQVVAAELHRVTKPDGFVAMANWPPEGFIGRLFDALQPEARSALRRDLVDLQSRHNTAETPEATETRAEYLEVVAYRDPRGPAPGRVGHQGCPAPSPSRRSRWETSPGC